jgi:protein TonB
MRLDLFIGILLAAGIHVFVAFADQIFPAPTNTFAPVAEETPTIALNPLPQIEPEPPEQDDTAPPPEEAPDVAPPEIAPPMQTDVPAPVVNTAFQQTIQPPPPPNLGGPSTVIAIPKGNFSGKAVDLRNVFDLNQLDQKPSPTFDPKPNYPYEMRRSRISGRVTVGFMIDSEGNPVNPYIVSSSNSGFDSEALRTVHRTKFRPGRKGGKAVTTRKVVRDIIFSLPPN